MSKSFDKAKVRIYSEVNLTELADSFFDYVSDEDFVEFVKGIFSYGTYDESPAMQELYKFFKTAKKEGASYVH